MQNDKACKWLSINMLAMLAKIINRKVKRLDKQKL